VKQANWIRRRLMHWYDDVIGSRVELIRHLPLGGGGLVVTVLLVDILLGLLPVAFVIAMSFVIGSVPGAVRSGLDSPAWATLVRAFLLAAAAFVAQTVLAPVQVMLGELMTRRVDGRLQERLIATSLRSTGIGPLEDPVALDALNEVTHCFEGRLHTPGSGLAGQLALLSRYLRLAALVVLAGTVAGWTAALVLTLATAAFRTGQRGGLRAFTRVYDGWVGGALRRAYYLRDVAMGARHAKELRVFGLTSWFADRYADRYTAAQQEVSRARWRVYLVPYLAYTAFGLAVAVYVFVSLGSGAAHGSVPLTRLALALQATMGVILLGAHYPEADLQTALGIRTLKAMRIFETCVADADRQAPVPGAAAVVEATGCHADSVRFERVSFAYPRSARTVLDELDLELPAGRSTAIVGVNGTGKTTLVKLLTRLYDPLGGRITADGIDLRQIPVGAWRRQVSIVFQDFVRYELSAADNIAWGAPHAPRDLGAVRESARRSGILDTLDALPAGLDTVLSRSYEGGVELSGGQWQRIAIARSLYALAAGATVLVLDEPASALDVRAEAAFFESFIELTRGATSILISHRLSTVRRADRIVVLDGGRMVEQGSHDELMAARGQYAELFRLQAERFAAGLDAEDEGAVRSSRGGR
jgi:ATP-binding cassette subfamily B protein